MSDDILLRIALAPAGLFIWCRYLVWPLAVAAMIGLVYVRINPRPAHVRTAVIVRVALIAAGALLFVSLALAYLLIPKSDRQLHVIWYGAAVGSIPVLLTTSVACCVRLYEGTDTPLPH